MLGVLNPVGGGDPIPLKGEKLLVGRRSTCDIVLKFPSVSSNHCEFRLVDGYWEVRDLGSSNGVKVNGEKVTEHSLMPGDEITIARHHTFTVDYTPAEGATAPNAPDPFAMGLMEKAGLGSGKSQPPPTAGGKAAARKSARKTQSSEDDFIMDWLAD